jgi:hypothetical protein
VKLNWNVAQFASTPGEVEATVEYPVDYADLPIVGGLFPTMVRAEHIEWVDPFRSGATVGMRDGAGGRP